MAGVVRNWRIELIGAYPDLFHPPAGAPEAAQGSPECGEGWRDLLDRACVRIRAAVQADGGTFKFSQIKEKYGSARLYWDGTLSPDAYALVEEAIALAEGRSAVTCEVCGEEGRLYGGWLTTRCAAHAEGRPAVEARTGFENMHIVRHMSGGKNYVTCRSVPPTRKARRSRPSPAATTCTSSEAPLRAATRLAATTARGTDSSTLRPARRSEMTHMDWRRDLMLWHPRLFLTMTEEPSRSFGYPHCERGWQDILVRLCRRIEIALRDRETFEFVRIKQKMGILRVDWDAEASEETEAKIGHAVDLAVARSACTCEICGAEGRLHDDRGQLATRCAEHAAGSPVPPRYGHGFENIRRLRRWRGQADVYYARYDRETDTLTEVPSPSTDRKG